MTGETVQGSFYVIALHASAWLQTSAQKGTVTASMHVIRRAKRTTKAMAYKDITSRHCRPSGPLSAVGARESILLNFSIQSTSSKTTTQ